MRCLVTGASGHLGSFLTQRLINEGWIVTVLVRYESDLSRLADVLNQVVIVRANLSSVSEAAQAIKNAEPEVVFHLAWEGVTSEFKNAPLQTEENVSGSLKLLEIAREAGCKHWIGMGSQAEYGTYDDVLTEDTPTNPLTAYGAGKLSVGLKTRSFCERYGIGYTWVRLLATYGPMDDERHLIPSVILQLLKGRRPRLTSGEQRWDYLYVTDAAEATYQLAANGAQGVFNVGSGKSYSVRGILERIRDLIDPSLELGFGDLDYTEDQIMRLATSIDALRRATGWTPRVDLDEGLTQTVDWYRTRESEE
ncbi:MAG TPA: NAD(P)-dependent oxidoreductase [Pyrinomonadaceae bacterium]|nr:NAD(P)-dependent oxidoreductase [Pyrinomonadaceae bacterium]